jgi:hypothetical protein
VVIGITTPADDVKGRLIRHNANVPARPWFSGAGPGPLAGWPGPGTGPDLELLTAVMRHYQQITGRQLSTDRVMAWHLRTALGDALWRSEAGIPLADHRTPAMWVEDLSTRFSALGIDPEAPPAAIRHR